MKKFNQKPMAFLIKVSVFCIFFSLLSIQSKAQPHVRLEFSNEHYFDSVSPYGATTDIYIRVYTDETLSTLYTFDPNANYGAGEYLSLTIPEYTTGAYPSYLNGEWDYHIGINSNESIFLGGVLVSYYASDPYTTPPNAVHSCSYTLHYAISPSASYVPEDNYDDMWY
jgi:hypothetical protein